MSFPYPRSIAPGRCIVFIICLSLTAMLSMPSSKHEAEPAVYHNFQFVPRQNPLSGIVSPSPPAGSDVVSETRPPTQGESSVTPQNSNTNPSVTPSDGNAGSSTTPEVTSTPTPPPSGQSQSQQFSSVVSTGADGSSTVVVIVVQASDTNSAANPGPSSNQDNDSSGLGTGSIIGLSVAGGIALLGIIAFFVWKFTRKHRSATYDDGEIKWPELNSESHVVGHDEHAVPAALSDGSSIRDQSFRGAYSDGGLGASQSQVDLYAADPYAVPPLPHLNPNQPYRDDPGAAPYHDNFSVQAFHESRPSSPAVRGEAIPMNQINRTRSPGPQASLYAGHGGRQSPGPQEAYGGGYGRQSPGPQDAYGGGYGRRSPGPHDAYGPR